MIPNLLRSVLPTWRMLEVVRWQNDPPPWRHSLWSSARTDVVVTTAWLMMTSSLVTASSPVRI
jgi:hypothetical protein